MMVKYLKISKPQTNMKKLYTVKKKLKKIIKRLNSLN